MKVEADEAAGQPREKVDHQVGEVAKEPFDDLAPLPEDEHVHADVDDSEMDEHFGEEPPGLVVGGEGTVAGAPPKHLLRGGIEQPATRENHQAEDQGVGGDEGLGNVNPRREGEEPAIKRHLRRLTGVIDLDVNRLARRLRAREAGEIADRYSSILCNRMKRFTAEHAERRGENTESMHFNSHRSLRSPG